MTVSHSLSDTPGREVIPTIASFDTKGNMQPLYIRINDLEYKILSCFTKNKNNSYIEFECQIQDYDRLKRICLCYSFFEHVWFLDKRAYECY